MPLLSLHPLEQNNKRARGKLLYLISVHCEACSPFFSLFVGLIRGEALNIYNSYTYSIKKRYVRCPQQFALSSLFHRENSALKAGLVKMFLRVRDFRANSTFLCYLYEHW